jgi:zinc D-Ala-D-Ala carboxypeptidase
MRCDPLHLFNAESVDAMPARLAAPRRLAHARLLAASGWLLRRKEDGRYLAGVQDHHGSTRLLPLDHSLPRSQACIADLLAMMGLGFRGRLAARAPTSLHALDERRPAPAMLPMTAMHARLHMLAIDPARYRASSGLCEVAEPRELAFAGFDRYRRALWLRDPAARAWRSMVQAAAADDVAIDAISGFRSHAYQHGIFRRKLARGLRVEQILAVNAAPGFSEHHGGCALDIGTPGEPPAEESFEATAAFAWLSLHAPQHGFRMTYPRGNPHGIVYEPWHWCWVGTGRG